MNKGKTIFSQIMSLIPERDFKACVDRYKGNYRARNFTCRDQFLVMSYAQLTGRDSLRDIENCLMALSTKLYHCGISYAVPHNTLAKANENRDWHIYKDSYRPSTSCLVCGQDGRMLRRKGQSQRFNNRNDSFF